MHKKKRTRNNKFLALENVLNTTIMCIVQSSSSTLNSIDNTYQNTDVTVNHIDKTNQKSSQCMQKLDLFATYNGLSI